MQQLHDYSRISNTVYMITHMHTHTYKHANKNTTQKTTLKLQKFYQLQYNNSDYCVVTYMLDAKSHTGWVHL